MAITKEDYVTVAWRHVMCYRCWFDGTGNIIYTRDRKEYASAILPKLADRVSDSVVRICCVCDGATVGGALFLEAPDALFCDHMPNGEVRVIPVLKQVKGGKKA